MHCPTCGAQISEAEPSTTTPILAAIAVDGEGFRATNSSLAEAFTPWSNADDLRLNELANDRLGSGLQVRLPDATFRGWIRSGRSTFAEQFTRRQALVNLEFAAASQELL